MSHINVGEFFIKAATDQELRDQVKSFDSEKDFFTLGKSAGFEFSEEEWMQVYSLRSAIIMEEIRNAYTGEHSVGETCMRFFAWKVLHVNIDLLLFLFWYINVG